MAPPSGVELTAWGPHKTLPNFQIGVGVKMARFYETSGLEVFLPVTKRVMGDKTEFEFSRLRQQLNCWVSDYLSLRILVKVLFKNSYFIYLLMGSCNHHEHQPSLYMFGFSVDVGLVRPPRISSHGHQLRYVHQSRSHRSSESFHTLKAGLLSNWLVS